MCSAIVIYGCSNVLEPTCASGTLISIGLTTVVVCQSVPTLIIDVLVSHAETLHVIVVQALDGLTIAGTSRVLSAIDLVETGQLN
jgi:hypothetical protein